MTRLWRARRQSIPVYRRSDPLTIRWAMPEDAPALRTLAQLDGKSALSAPILLALVGDELWAAVSLATGTVLAHPFRRSAAVAALAVERGRQLTVTHPTPRSRRAWRPRPRPAGEPILVGRSARLLRREPA